MKDLRHLDQMPDSALIPIPVFAKLAGQGLSTVWRKLAEDPKYPETIRLGARCTRVRLGDVRKLLSEGAQ
jgi:predicted DNA-binding transcriptional regulator AlpA